MYGFQCGELAKPVYFGLKMLKQNVLGGVTGKDAVSVAICAASHLHAQPGGAELLRAFYADLQKTAPSDMAPFFSAEVSERGAGASPSAVGEAPHERVVLQAGR